MTHNDLRKAAEIDRGIEFTRNKKEGIARGWIEFRYSRTSPFSGEAAERKIYCKTHEDFSALLNLWNQSAWIFEEI